MTSIQLSGEPKNSRSYGALQVNQFTLAPLRVKKTIEVNCSAEQAFAFVSNHQQMHTWIPMIKHQVSVNHQHSETPGQNNVGSQRICNFGGDILTEQILYWQQNEMYAYSVIENKQAPAINHLGVFQVIEQSSNRTLIVWAQYFDPKPWSIKSKMMPIMMRFVMNRALKNAKKQLQN